MMRLLVCVLSVLGTVAARDADAMEKNRPVTKVVNMMKDMIKQLEKEAEEDADIFENIGCWCTTNEKEKTASVAAAQERITVLQSTIEVSTADFARLNAEVAQLKKELGKNSEALEEAGALREKQLAEFTAEEKETITSVTSLKGAVQVLSKVQEGASLLQVSGARELTRQKALEQVRGVLHRHRDMFLETLEPSQRRLIEDFTAPQHYEGISLLQQAAKQPSGAIFGILGQMKEDFETNLAKSSKEETANVAAYADLKKAKESEIAAATELIDTKTGEAATADEKKAAAKEDLAVTEESLAADNQFLQELKVKCTNVDAEFEARTKERQLEIQAVTKALEFLTSDEAHDLFSRTFNPGFLQLRARSLTKKRIELSRIMKRAASEVRDPRLAELQVSIRVDAFEIVRKNIQAIVDKLLKESDDDIKHKDYCIDEFNTNEVDTAAKTKEKTKIEASIEDFSMTIEDLHKALGQLKVEIADLQAAQVKASEIREKANKDFQMEVSDQQATVKLLQGALKALEGFYGKAALLQGSARAWRQPSPPGFKTMEKNPAGGGVMGMINDIIKDAKELEAEARRGEEAEQADFEEFTKETTASIDEKTKDTISKSEALAKAEGDRVQAEAERDTATQELEELDQEKSDLHKSCDFLLKNFDTRKTARDGEIEALKKGIAVFSGQSFGSFLQRM